MTDFISIISQDNIKIAIQRADHFTFGTSPYYAHQNGLAVDIYNSLLLENYEVLSPVSGKVTKIRILKAPHPRFPNGINRDYVILIENPCHPNSVFKIMHINTSLNEGDWIEIGDHLGRTIKNGYFAPWSSPHIHLEIRPKDDAIRARGGEDINLALEPTHNNKSNIKSQYIEKIPVQIDEITEEFVLCRFKLEEFYYNMTPICGIRAKIDDLNCILDGGLPHYKKGIAIFQKRKFTLDLNRRIMLNNRIVGNINEVKNNFGFINFQPIAILFNEEQLRGISFFLANKQPQIKIIPIDNANINSISQSSNYITINHI